MASFDMNLLRVFDALMRHRSVTAAARELGLTQSSVSNALSRLRESLGDRLLERRGNAMAPTRVALDLWPEVASGLAQVASALAKRESFDPAKATATYRVAMGDYALALLGADFAAAVSASAPNVTLELTDASPTTASQDLTAGELDLIVGAVAEGIGRLTTTPLLEERFVGLVAKAHPLLGASSPGVDAFVAYPHILTSPRGRTIGNVDAGLRRIGKARKVSVAVPSFVEAARICAGGDSVLCCGERLARRLAAMFELAVFELPVDAPGFVLKAAAAPANRSAPSLRWLLQTLQSVTPKSATQER